MKKMAIFIVVLALLVLMVVVVYAQTGGGYALTWWTIDNGGGQNIVSATYALSVTHSQPDAASASGGSYALSGGYWSGASPVGYKNFLPTIIR